MRRKSSEMEFTLSGNALKTVARSITCLFRVGSDLAIQASPSQLSFHALNSSRSAYQLIAFKLDIFDVFIVFGAEFSAVFFFKVLQWRRYPSNFVVRPRDLNRMLANFQSSLQEITIIATECNSNPSDAASEFGGKLLSSKATSILPKVDMDYILFNRIWRRTSWFRFWLPRTALYWTLSCG
ncbi:hypothetical protein NL676_020137 [Syzygium grande]|nr:hypothetical protein NL676_020137 [Syzygium grande]